MLVVALLGGCGPGSSDRKEPGASLTSGVLRIAAEPDVAPLVRETAESFVSLYPSATIHVEARSSREAMADVFADRADLAVIGREVEAVERQAATEAQVEMEAYRWAREGVAVVVHPANPVQQVAYEDLRDALSAAEPTWADVGGDSRRIVPVMQEPERSLAQYVARQLLDLEVMGAEAVTVPDDSATQAVVRRERDALGFVAQSRLVPGVKVLAVSRTKGMPYVGLDAQTVYDRDYPLTRSYQIVTRVPGVPLAHGWITYATSDDGQRLVRDFGLVPATVPVRFKQKEAVEPWQRPGQPGPGNNERNPQR